MKNKAILIFTVFITILMLSLIFTSCFENDSPNIYESTAEPEVTEAMAVIENAYLVADINAELEDNACERISSTVILPDIICIKYSTFDILTSVMNKYEDYVCYYEVRDESSGTFNAILWDSTKLSALKKNTIWLDGDLNMPTDNGIGNNICSYVLLEGEYGKIAVFNADIAINESVCKNQLHRIGQRASCYTSYFPIYLSVNTDDSNMILSAYKLEKRENGAYTSSAEFNSIKAYLNYIVPQETEKQLDINGKMIALTYDDGPSYYGHTDKILDALEKHNAKATFFCVGRKVKSGADKLLRIKELSCELANHTNDHEGFADNNLYVIKNSLNSTSDLIEQATGIRPFLVRPPGGTYKNAQGKITDIDNPMILWSIDTKDYVTGKTADDVIESIMNNVFDGAIVLMHDVHAPSAEAADVLIASLLEKGYQPVTVSELIEFSDIELENTAVYTSAKKVYTK